MSDRDRLYDTEPDVLEFDEILPNRQPYDEIDLKPPAADFVPVNAGAAHAALLGSGEMMLDPQRDEDAPDPDRPWSEDFTKSLMHKKVHGGHGGGGGSGRRRKPLKPVTISAPVLDGDDEGEPGVRFQVYGLTLGEADFYHRRGAEEARSVLRQHCAKIRASEYAPESFGRRNRTARMKHSFDVYGLTENEVELLRLHPGSSRRMLAEHAHAVDGQRVNAVDRGAA